MVLHSRLGGIPEQLAHHELHVRRRVAKGRISVAMHLDARACSEGIMHLLLHTRTKLLHQSHRRAVHLNDAGEAVALLLGCEVMLDEESQRNALREERVEECGDLKLLLGVVPALVFERRERLTYRGARLALFVELRLGLEAEEASVVASPEAADLRCGGFVVARVGGCILPHGTKAGPVQSRQRHPFQALCPF